MIGRVVTLLTLLVTACRCHNLNLFSSSRAVATGDASSVDNVASHVRVVDRPGGSQFAGVSVRSGSHSTGSGGGSGHVESVVVQSGYDLNSQPGDSDFVLTTATNSQHGQPPTQVTTFTFGADGQTDSHHVQLPSGGTHVVTLSQPNTVSHRFYAPGSYLGGTASAADSINAQQQADRANQLLTQMRQRIVHRLRQDFGNIDIVEEPPQYNTVHDHQLNSAHGLSTWINVKTNNLIRDIYKSVARDIVDSF